MKEINQKMSIAILTGLLVGLANFAVMPAVGLALNLGVTVACVAALFFCMGLPRIPTHESAILAMTAGGMIGFVIVGLNVIPSQHNAG